MTAQIGDHLILDGETVMLTGCPALPWHHPRFKEISRKEAIQACAKTLVFSTACWRNYVADWRIDQDRLYLERITGIYRLAGEEPLFADWVTETLRISRGEMLTYVHMGFGSVYEEDLLLDVRMGVVVGRAVRDNRGREQDENILGWENLPTSDTVTPGLKPGKH